MKCCPKRKIPKVIEGILCCLRHDGRIAEYILYIHTVIECLAADTYHAFRNEDRSKASTIPECSILNRGHSIGYFDSFQAFTTAESG